ncbi:MAG: hypothetical protein H0U59_04685 [Gemmatimonadaceae bacterium]|nr:hypothetical protein [Gemmatimonadaceae bacterium]
MTNGTVVGMLLHDLILEREDSWSDVFNPNRSNLTGVSDLVGQTDDIVKHFVGNHMTDEYLIASRPVRAGHQRFGEK